MKTDEKTWEYFGDNDPYFGVYSVEDMRQESLDDTKINEFFRTGDLYVKRIWDEIERSFVPSFTPERSLDFGCGVGRLVIPIAKRSRSAVGIDVSDGMLKLARDNAEKFRVKNITFIKSHNALSQLEGNFDFVHSFIVFQHIDPTLGIPIFRKLVESLESGGIGVLHIQFANSVSSGTQKLMQRLYRHLPFLYSLRNLILRKRQEPMMPLYLYDVNKLLSILQENECHKCHISFSDHGASGAVLFFQKKKQEMY